LVAGLGYSVVTFAQSHSNSSATSWARPVSVPCPISERAMRMITRSSGCTTTQALISSGKPAWALAASVRYGIAKPRVRPAAAPSTTKPRRVTFIFGIMTSASSRLFVRGHVDPGAHASGGSAAAYVGDFRIDISVRGVGIARQQRGRSHAHAGLAIAAFRYVEFDPGLLHRVRSI